MNRLLVNPSHRLWPFSGKGIRAVICPFLSSSLKSGFIRCFQTCTGVQTFSCSKISGRFNRIFQKCTAFVRASDSDNLVLHSSYVNGEIGNCPDPIFQTVSGVHVWKQRWKVSPLVSVVSCGSEVGSIALVSTSNGSKMRSLIEGGWVPLQIWNEFERKLRNKSNNSFSIPLIIWRPV